MTLESKHENTIEGLESIGTYLLLRKENGHIRVDGTPEWSQGKPLSQNKEGNNGTFLSWKWNGKSLFIRNDRYGMYPLFYAQIKDGIVIATNLATAIKFLDSRTLNYEALAVYLRLGYMVGNDSALKELLLLPPNSEMLWQDGNLNIDSVPVTSCFSANLRLSYDEAIDGYNHYFQQAIARRLPETGKFTVPISGGRDSRHILFELCKQGAQPETSMTLKYRPPATNEDERIGKLICEQLDISHQVIERPENWFAAVRDELYLSNFAGGGHSWILPMAKYLNTHGYQTTYDGLAGDIISAGHTLDSDDSRMLSEGHFETFARKLLKSAGFEDFNLQAFSSEFAELTSFEVALNRVVEELKKHADCGNPLMAFTFWNRSRRAIGSIPFAILADIQTVHCPYLDSDFFDFCTGLNPEFSINKPFHDEVISRAYPQWSQIPYEDKSLVAKIDKDCKQYYRRSVVDFTAYLWARRSQSATMLSEKYMRTRVLKSFITGSREQPWYLRRALYMYELDKLMQQ